TVTPQTPTPQAPTPPTPTQQLLIDIWRDLLDVPHVGVDDNFFTLGGDSVLSIQVAARARRSNLPLTTQQLFRYQALADLAAQLDEQSGPIAPVAQVAQVAAPDRAEPESGDVPLTPIQHWFFEQQLAAPHHWNQAVLLDVAADAPPASWQDIVR